MNSLPHSRAPIVAQDGLEDLGKGGASSPEHMRRSHKLASSDPITFVSSSVERAARISTSAVVSEVRLTFAATGGEGECLFGTDVTVP